MGIKSIKAVENYLHPTNDTYFDYQSMVHINKKQSVQKYYTFGKLLGSGTYGDVYEATSINSHQKRAIKMINTLKFPKAKQLFMTEIELLKSLDHPNILKIYEIFEEHEYSYIVTELCHGKELFDLILVKHNFNQNACCFIVYDLVSAVKCMHSNHIMHRDLKPENIMFDVKTKILKLIDFGSGVRFESSELKPRKRVGTSFYIAPEVLARFYNEQCDIWSLGVILYILLSGEPPFPGDDDFEIMKDIQNGVEVSFKRDIWRTISKSGKDLVTKMMERDVHKRLNIDEVMRHEWFSSHISKPKLLKNQECNLSYHLKNMQTYKDLDSSPLQEGIIIFIVNFVKDKKDEQSLIRSFKQLDVNGDGVISLEELKMGLTKYLQISPVQGLEIAKKIFERVDINRSGAIDFSEFVMSATNIQIMVTEQNLDIAFDYIDADKSGKLSVQEIRQKLSSNISEEQYSNLLKQFDKNHDGEISKPEFKEMMKALVRRKRK